jgi:hypothetical protein
MPVTDTEQLIREATMTILNADTALRTLFGRTVNIVLERNTIARGIPLPVLAYDLLNYDEAAGRATMLLTSVSNAQTNAGQVCRNALELAEAALTAPAYQTAGLDYIAPMIGVRQSVEEVEDIRGFLEMDSPTLQQADVTLVLQVLN